MTPSPDSLTFIGNATTVLRLGPFTLLTDPNFLHRGQFAYLPPVMGSLLELRNISGVLRLYISGDTLLVEELREIPRRIERPAAVLHLGGTTLPGGLVVTMDAEQGADLIELIDPGVAVPVHHSDYGVFKSPLSDFRTEVERRGLASKVRWVEPGGDVPLRR